MQGRSLYTKIFLWFWLAIILVASAALVSSAWILAYSDPSTQHALQMAAVMQQVPAHMAVEAWERSGRPGLQEHFNFWKHRTGRQMFLCEADGQELSGQTLPEGLASLISKTREGGAAQGERLEGKLFAAIPAVGMNDHRYVFVSEVPLGPELGAGRRPPPDPSAARSEFPPPGPPGRPGGPPGPGGEPFPPDQPPPSPLSFLLERPQRLAIVLFAVIITGGGLCYWLARYLTRPLSRLRAATTQLAEGNLSVRVGSSLGLRRDEIGALGQDFDRMAERIEALLAGQRRLLSDISHELRSPLARLNVALGIARQHAGPEPRSAYEQCLARIESESTRLNELIGEVLMLARLDSGMPLTTDEPVDLAGLVSRIVKDGQYEAQARRVQVQLTGDGTCTVCGNPELLRRAIENVVRNAIYYTAEATTVDVALALRAEGTAPAAVITIRDHGPGLPEDALQQIFQPFYRVQGGRERATGGTGLGLAITDRAIRAHHGAVTAANAPDGGLIVTIRVPTQSAPKPKKSGPQLA